MFAAKGYHDAQMTEIAAAAELSRASPYALFDGKHEIYQEVIRDASAHMRDGIRDRIGNLSDPRERVLGLIDALLECFDENRGALRMILLGTNGLPWRIQQNMGASSNMLAAFQHWVVDQCQEAEKAGGLEGLDPETVGLSLIGAVTSVAAHALQTDSGENLSSHTPRVRAVFERLLS
ncbi:MAG: TetR/AcrR family transcriptional regulator [bacterium]|nr:TetR/AcrR family transcriptional regulator [bacterium]